jgi:hypothetical protein
MPILNNEKHERFAQELANGANATEAYARAGFARNRKSAHKLRHTADVGRRVAELLGQRENIHAQATAAAIEATALTKEWVIENLKRFAKKASTDSASVRATELLGKELGMLVELSADVSAHYAISDKPMPIEEWETKYVRPN